MTDGWRVRAARLGASGWRGASPLSPAPGDSARSFYLNWLQQAAGNTELATT
jgi:hypothetical protein